MSKQPLDPLFVPIKQDVVFDRLADRFQKRIYNSRKGEIRLQILKHEFNQHILPSLQQKQSPNIVDIGAGFAQLSIWLAKQDYKLSVCEPSEKMLHVAREHIQSAGVEARIALFPLTLQQFFHASHKQDQQYDLIIFHAVLEWLAEPEQALRLVAKQLKPGGTLSIIFYNRHAIALRSLLGGDFKRVMTDQLDGVGQKGLTPISPLIPQDVVNWVESSQLNIKHWSGLRTFYDYMKPEAAKQASIDDVIAMEEHLAASEPWRSIARYQHIICTK